MEREVGSIPVERKAFIAHWRALAAKATHVGGSSATGINDANADTEHSAAESSKNSKSSKKNSHATAEQQA